MYFRAAAGLRFLAPVLVAADFDADRWNICPAGWWLCAGLGFECLVRQECTLVAGRLSFRFVWQQSTNGSVLVEDSTIFKIGWWGTKCANNNFCWKRCNDRSCCLIEGCSRTKSILRVKFWTGTKCSTFRCNRSRFPLPLDVRSSFIRSSRNDDAEVLNQTN